MLWRSKYGNNILTLAPEILAGFMQKSHSLYSSHSQIYNKTISDEIIRYINTNKSERILRGSVTGHSLIMSPDLRDPCYTNSIIVFSDHCILQGSKSIRISRSLLSAATITCLLKINFVCDTSLINDRLEGSGLSFAILWMGLSIVAYEIPINYLVL